MTSNSFCTTLPIIGWRNNFRETPINRRQDRDVGVMKRKIFAVALLAVSLCACKESDKQTAVNACGPTPTEVNSELLAAIKASSKDLKMPNELAKAIEAQGLGEAVHQLSWHLCNARTNGWVDDAFYREQFIALRQSVAALVAAPNPQAAPAAGAP